ncbi:GNAT family N-acetyltransferase [Serratia marcescens]|uniref:GNAT family N-acetyltransferase n=1 Tax=Serratia marcescens TaxID=615 RepID=UPI0013148CAA|nr:GNAT family N-acetyltransferase [Serratia marcescens]
MLEYLIKQIHPGTDSILSIISELYDEYEKLYGLESSSRHTKEPFYLYLPPRGIFITLETENNIIAIGAYKPFSDDTAEIKRIWIHPEYRGQKIAGLVLHELERLAKKSGYSNLYLTTGTKQHKAVNLYLREGFKPHFDINISPDIYEYHPYDGKLRFTKEI